MKVVVVIPCHNQDEIVKINIKTLLERQTVIPDNILVVNDHSDSFNVTETDVVKTITTTVKGRSSTRNLGIATALNMGADLIIFMDGDTIPEHDQYIENYIALFPREIDWGKFVFGTRKHIARPIPGTFIDFYNGLDPKLDTLKKYPSDLLTGNMDFIISDAPVTLDMLDPRDLRIIAGVTDQFNTLNHEEKIDVILSGMVTWSCNFAVNKSALNQLRSHNLLVHGREFWFDDNDFNSGWGYEDVALGLDALFSGVDILMTKSSDILHFIHDRSDELFTHVGGRHKIMDRYRKLYKNRIMNAIREIK